LLEVARGVELLDLLAQRGQRAGDLRALGHGALLQRRERSVEEAAGGFRGATDLVVAHPTDRGDFALELRGLRLQRGQRSGVRVDGGGDPRRGRFVHLDGRGRLLVGYRLDWRGWLENELVSRLRLGRGSHSGWSSLCLPDETDIWGRGLHLRFLSG